MDKMDLLVLPNTGRLGRRRTSSLSDVEKFNQNQARPETWPELKVIGFEGSRLDKN